jgi:hypothetical protein
MDIEEKNTTIIKSTDEKKSTNILTDGHGKPSTKRFWGSISIGISIVVKGFVAVFSIFSKVTDLNAINNTTDSLLFAGCILLGIGVAEYFAKK